MFPYFITHPPHSHHGFSLNWSSGASVYLALDESEQDSPYHHTTSKHQTAAFDDLDSTTAPAGDYNRPPQIMSFRIYLELATTDRTATPGTSTGVWLVGQGSFKSFFLSFYWWGFLVEILIALNEWMAAGFFLFCYFFFSFLSFHYLRVATAVAVGWCGGFTWIDINKKGTWTDWIGLDWIGSDWIAVCLIWEILHLIIWIRPDSCMQLARSACERADGIHSIDTEEVEPPKI